MESIEPVPGASTRFVRLEERGVPIRVALTTYPPGTVVPEHRHAHWQVFMVQEGRGVYSLDGAEVVAEPGDLVAVPSNALHGFRVDGDAPLCHLSVLDPPHAED
jgi:quercetin dioxygenase-like cupin family protein